MLITFLFLTVLQAKFLFPLCPRGIPLKLYGEIKKKDCRWSAIARRPLSSQQIFLNVLAVFSRLLKKKKKNVKPRQRYPVSGVGFTPRFLISSDWSGSFFLFRVRSSGWDRRIEVRLSFSPRIQADGETQLSTFPAAFPWASDIFAVTLPTTARAWFFDPMGSCLLALTSFTSQPRTPQGNACLPRSTYIKTHTRWHAMKGP